MANRRFEMYQYRQILARMRSGDSDRDIASADLAGRRKAAEIRRQGVYHGWFDPSLPLPDEATLAEVLAPATNKAAVSSQV